MSWNIVMNAVTTTIKNLSPAQWYAIAMMSAVGLLRLQKPLQRILRWTRHHALRKLAYPLIFQQRYLGTMTNLHTALVIGYLFLNGYCMGIGIKTKSDFAIRTGSLATVNMIPLFFGGRTSFLANLLGISLHSYYISHHWIGTMVVLQGLLHVAFSTWSRKWAFSLFQISGITSASALALLFVMSLWFIRRIIYEIFIISHFILALVVLILLMVHLQSRKAKSILVSILPVLSLTLWIINALIRVWNLIHYNIGGQSDHNGRQATIVQFLEGGTCERDQEQGQVASEDGKRKVISALKMTVHLQRPRKMCPGQYVYLSFSDLGKLQSFQSRPFVISWWDESMKATELSFLIKPDEGLSAILANRDTIRNVTIDGPYGTDLALDRCETVILIAKGIGIASILPHVRHMTYRKASKLQDNSAYRRESLTRKIDIIWVLEENSQEQWVSEWFQDLQQKDAGKLLLTSTCFYPHEKQSPPPIIGDDHWRFVYQPSQDPLQIIDDHINSQIKRSPGTTKIAVCGDLTFSNHIRKTVIKTMGTCHNVEFLEMDFQPKDKYPIVHQAKGDVEIGGVIVRGNTRVDECRTSRETDNSHSGRKEIL